MPQTNKVYLHPETGEPQTQSKIYLDDNGDELNQSKEESKQEDGMLKSAWNWATTPLTNLPSEFASMGANALDKPSLDRSPLRARIEGFAGGALEGLGGLVDDATSPLGIATTLGPEMIGAGIKGATRLAGYPTELTGKVIKNYGIGIPRIIESRMQRGIERGVGQGIEKLGKGMKSVGIKPLEGEIVLPDIKDAEYTVKPQQKALPASKTSFYETQSKPKPFIDMLDEESALQDGQDIQPPKTFKVINNESVKPSTVKPKVRPNGDGTFTNIDTGEVLDGQMRPIIEYNGKPISKDSPFFTRNRQ
jgi:hypothetical protein